MAIITQSASTGKLQGSSSALQTPSVTEQILLNPLAHWFIKTCKPFVLELFKSYTGLTCNTKEQKIVISWHSEKEHSFPRVSQTCVFASPLQTYHQAKKGEEFVSSSDLCNTLQ